MDVSSIAALVALGPIGLVYLAGAARCAYNILRYDSLMGGKEK